MAEVSVLFEGYVGPGQGGNHVGGTASLVVAGERIIVVDPGLCPGPASLLDPLAVAGYDPDSVTEVVLSYTWGCEG
ncbi:MAG: hypothetical protein ACR2HR_12790 [Euzebya sp.]